jgi:aminomethyltransferase
MVKRVSALDATVRELGAIMGEWNNMAVAFTYPQDPHLEHNAIREAAGLWDTSALTKIHVRGKDALAAVNYLATRDMAKIPVAKAAYCPILKDDGHFCDDGYIYHISDNHFLVVSSIGPSLQYLQEYAQRKDLSIEPDEDMHILTLQGPKSLEILNPNTSEDLSGLAFCHQTNTKLFGTRSMISRTGYSGERGYEIFLRADEAVPIWQALFDYGTPMGLLPVSFDGLEMVHIESGLMAYGAEATEDNTPWEVDFGWAVSRTKGDFRGSKALFELEGKEKVKLYGIVAEYDDVVEHGAELSINGEKVGHVTTPAYSRRLGKSLALVHLIPSAAVEGTIMELKGSKIQCQATAASIPFVDPERRRMHVM